MNHSDINHVAIIMDGNGRWATKRGLPRSAGHKQGAETFLKIVEAGQEFGLKYISAFVFSSENWGRPKEEVDYILDLMREYFKKQFTKLVENNVRVIIIGDKQRFPEDLQKIMHDVEDASKDKDGIVVNLAINYGGRLDIINACKNISRQVSSGDIDVNDIDDKLFSQNLYTTITPDPEIVIRTGGEYRISNFMLWQMAYSELFFSEKYWPDFTKEDLDGILTSYKQRNRRFGKV